MTKLEFDAKIGRESSNLLYARAEHIYLESNLFVHQQDLADYYKLFGERGINTLYFIVADAERWRDYCTGRRGAA